MSKVTFCAVSAILLVTVRQVGAFTTNLPLVARRSALFRSSELGVANPTSLGTSSGVDSSAITPDLSPTSVFGTKLDESTKERNKAMVGNLKKFLFDVLYAGDTRDRAFARFYALETIARMPYFSYLSVLHLYETLGWWRRASYLKLHFAESWNELHHLLIMEELGGNEAFIDRFIAQHAAFFYYWLVVGAYMFNPTFCYNLNQAVEEHAYDTYDEFLKQQKDWLESQPAPKVAQQYYRDGDLYMFDAHHSPTTLTQRRPKCDTLYDVFVAVRDDEAEHVKTMEYLQLEDDPDVREGANGNLI